MLGRLKLLWEYYKEVAKDTGRFFLKFAFYKLIFMFALFPAYVLSDKMITPENIGKTTDGLIGLGFVLIGIFAFNLFLYTPTRFFKHLHPKLKVNFKPGERPWVLDKQPTSSRQDFIFGIELMNSGLENIQNPSVRLLKIRPSPDDNFVVPDDLRLDNKYITKTDEEGDGEIVEVFEYNHYFGEGTDHLVMIGSIKSKYPRLKRRGF